MNYHAIDVEHPVPGIAILSFNRPAKRNALAIAMMRSLAQAMTDLEQDGKTRVVIVRGVGPVFCAGLDLGEASNHDLVRESAEGVARTLHCLRYSRLVTIAAVHGGAYAGGAGAVAACDMAIGTNDCQIGFPEARRGLLPALICDVLRTKVREGDLAELFLVGAPIDAQRAQQIGLFQRLVEPARLIEEAIAMGRGILAGGPQTIRDTKTLLHHAYGHTEGGAHSIDEHLRARLSEEADEGLRAFLEKRPPRWLAI